MPSTSIRLAPGVNSDRTPSLNEAGISASNLIRFREGLIEKRGGWTRYGSAALLGTPRAIWPYRDFTGNVFAAVGATGQLAVISNGTLSDITPRFLLTQGTATFSVSTSSALYSVTDPGYNPSNTDTVMVEDIVSIGGVTLSGLYRILPTGSHQYYIIPPSGNFKFPPSTESGSGHLPTYSTTAGSAIVNVQLQAHGLAGGFQYAVQNPVVVGGVTIKGAITVAAVVDANNFTIYLSQAATSSASAVGSGGQVNMYYTLSTAVGQPVVGSRVQATDWSLGNYGQLLIACAVGGQIYQWNSTGFVAAASAITTAPIASGIVISDAAQQIIAYGGNANSLFDPNYVAWSDTGNPNQWTAAIGNQAGSYRIPTGSAIIGAAAVAQSLILLWTDVDVWAMQYIGYPQVYGFTKLATGCGLIGQFAWARMGGLTYWMSQNKFWVFDGQSVQPIDCPIYDNIFPVISKANAWKIRGGSNAAYGEVMWFFPSATGSGENDTYVCFNPAEGTWDYGQMARSAWADQSVAGLPLGADPQGNVYQHETSPDAAGQPMAWSFTTGLFQVSEGEDYVFIDRIRPDFKFPQGAGTVQVSVLVYRYPGDAPVVRGPYSFTAATEFITTRCRGRYVALQFAGNDLGSSWRTGRTQIRYQPNGRR